MKQKVIVSMREDERGNIIYEIDGVKIAEVYRDYMHDDMWAGTFGTHGSCNHETRTEANMFISGLIQNLFAAFNLGVIFA